MASEELNIKLESLKSYLLDMESLVVAFSGGVDSTFLVHVAHEVLGDKLLAVTALSSTYVERESRFAREFCAARNIRHQVIVSEELDIPGFAENSKDRCYHCKRELFSKLKQVACKEGLAAVADGTHADDANDYRPGRRALAELLIVSPLKEAGLGKNDIRELSRQRGLPTWNKPALACLASRFPYGSTINREKLLVVAKAEEFLLAKKFSVFRVRHHGNLARIEVGKEEMERMADPELRKEILDAFKTMGFIYITLDLEGYRTGSMNETLFEEGKIGRTLS